MKSKVCVVVVFICATAFLLSCAMNAALESGKLYLRQDNLDKAQEQLELAVQQVPENWEPHFLLGALYGKRKMYEEMNREFDAVVRLDSSKEDMVNKGDGGKYWTGRAELWRDWHNRGIGLLNAQKYEKAAEHFETAVQIWPSQKASYSQLALMYAFLDKKDEAAATSKKAEELGLDDAQDYESIGLAYLKIGEYSKAIQNLEKAIELSPDREVTWERLIDAYIGMEDYEGAIKVYEKRIEKNPQKADLYFQTGVLYARYMDDFEKASDYFQKTIDIDPANTDAIFNIGLSFMRLEKYDEALSYFERASELEPTNADVWERIGYLHNMKKEYEEARSHYEKAIEINPSHKEAWQGLIGVYQKLDMQDKSNEAFEMWQQLGGGEED